MDWPLSGREEELRSVLVCLTGAPARSVVLAGPSGTGKTRLADEVAHRLADQGWSVHRIVGTRAAQPLALGAAAHLLPPAREPWHDHLQLLREARSQLDAHLAGRRALIVVDDAQLLDDLTATLVLQLATAGPGQVLVTLQTPADPPDPITAIWRDRAAERLDLEPLSQSASAQLVESALDGPLELAAHRELWQLTEGNALFLRELVLEAVERGALGPAWRLLDPGRRPGALDAARRGGRAPPRRPRRGRARTALELLALCEPLEVDVLEQVAGADALALLERRGLIRDVGTRVPTTIRLGHPVHGEVLRDRIPTARMRQLARQLVAVAAEKGERLDVVQQVNLQLESGDRPSTELLVEAARRAVERLDLRTARRLAETAVELDDTFDAHLVLGEILGFAELGADADRALLRAGELAATDRDRGLAALARARNLFLRQGRPSEAVELVRTAAHDIGDPELLDELDALRAFFATLLGDLPDATAAGARVMVRDFRGTGALHTLTVSTVAQVLAGQLEQAEEPLALAERLATEHPEPMTGQLIAVTRLIGRHVRGDLRVAADFGRAGFAQTIERRDDAAAGVWAANLVAVLTDAGQVSEARRMASEARSLLGRIDRLGLLGATMAMEATLLAVVDEVDSASGLLDAIGPGEGDLRLQVLHGRARSWIAAAQGRVGEAAEIAAETAAARRGRGRAPARHDPRPRRRPLRVGGRRRAPRRPRGAHGGRPRHDVRGPCPGARCRGPRRARRRLCDVRGTRRAALGRRIRRLGGPVAPATRRSPTRRQVHRPGGAAQRGVPRCPDTGADAGNRAAHAHASARSPCSLDDA